ncbi:LLM class flavin-dependent oxidoreductase [Paenibacillus harenae]|uniref:HTH hxlR-type domain-containing protein n=1 Tax=Paenibacillus harenae TaxID=306543 RepID=A0ABT9TZW4_PAEHA|nr:winged helix-turn-helix transcriptional regulator [Paenibacillus harenae]MDQ0112253.1 hypothetical protein [Paenibacillus harenae]
MTAPKGFMLPTLTASCHRGKLPIWRAVGGLPESGIKAGLAGVPLTLATLSGVSRFFKTAVDAYRQAANQAGHDPANLPVATTTILYVAENSQDAQNEFYPHMDHVYRTMRGMPFPKHQFLQSANIEDALMVGSPQLVIEIILRSMDRRKYKDRSRNVCIEHSQLHYSTGTPAFIYFVINGLERIQMEQDLSYCRVEPALDVMTGRWKIPILYMHFQGTKRFSDLQKGIPNITKNADHATCVSLKSIILLNGWYTRLFHIKRNIH